MKEIHTIIAIIAIVLSKMLFFVENQKSKIDYIQRNL